VTALAGLTSPEAGRQAGPGALLVIPVGATEQHGPHLPLSIGQQAVELMPIELCRSATVTFGRVLLVCAHGGNAAAVRRAEQQLRAESRDMRAWLPRWGADAHAGRTETSLQLALAPGRVRLDLAEPGNRQPITDLMPPLRASSVRAVSSNGVLGDPAGASAAEGRAMLTDLLADLKAVVRDWRPR